MNYYIIGVAVLILLTVLLLWYVVRLARKRATAQKASESETSTRRSVSMLRWSFASAIAHIEANLASRWRRYRIPWIMLVGESGAGKSALIANWMQRHQQSHPEDVVFAHHLGCSNDASAIRPTRAAAQDMLRSYKQAPRHVKRNQAQWIKEAERLAKAA